MIITILLILLALIGFYCSRLLRQQQQVIEINYKRQRENQQIEKQNKQLQEEKSTLISEIQTQNNILQSLSETRAKMEEDAETAAQKIYQAKLKEVEDLAIQREQALTADYEKKAVALANQYNKASQELKSIEDKQLAYIQARQREEEIRNNQDYYRLVLQSEDLEDINLLRGLQHKLNHREVIDKIIYETYYRKPYNTLMSNIFGANSGASKICGIYKITDTVTGKVYIGQSLDIKERMKTHIKTGLSSNAATNKLYQAMKQDGVDNFTFELLETLSKAQLNEREKYWIEFYKAKELGLNDTRGGS